uniref:Uncharacterized protein n=1 Tax=Cucumis melo TaxID=3656 RepID=A0A9I9CKA3_CUCME
MASRLNQRKTAKKRLAAWVGGRKHVVERRLAAASSCGDRLCKTQLSWTEAGEERHKRRRRNEESTDAQFRWALSDEKRGGLSCSCDGIVQLSTTSLERGVAERAGGDSGLIE